MNADFIAALDIRLHRRYVVDMASARPLPPTDSDMLCKIHH